MIRGFAIFALIAGVAVLFTQIGMKAENAAVAALCCVLVPVAIYRKAPQ